MRNKNKSCAISSLKTKDFTSSRVAIQAAGQSLVLGNSSLRNIFLQQLPPFSSFCGACSQAVYGEGSGDCTQAGFRFRRWYAVRSSIPHSGNVSQVNEDAVYRTKHTGIWHIFSRSSEFQVIKDLLDMGSMGSVGCEIASFICFPYHLSSQPHWGLIRPWKHSGGGKSRRHRYGTQMALVTTDSLFLWKINKHQFKDWRIIHIKLGMPAECVSLT